MQSDVAAAEMAIGCAFVQRVEQTIVHGVPESNEVKGMYRWSVMDEQPVIKSNIDTFGI